MKLIPTVGGLVLIGVVVQTSLGTYAANGLRDFLGLHIVIGIAGLGIALVLAVFAYRSKRATDLSKTFMTLFTVLVLAQTIMGLQVLTGSIALSPLHRYLGYSIFAVGAIQTIVSVFTRRQGAVN